MAYSEEEKAGKFNEVCERITTGESVSSILRPGNQIVDKSTFFEWLAKDEEKSNRYTRACEARADLVFDQIMTISDATADDIITDPESGAEITNHNVIQRDRLRVDARKWMLSKMNPKKYGEKIQQDHTTNGKDIMPAINVYNQGPPLASSENQIDV
jgi:hypothetical protein